MFNPEIFTKILCIFVWFFLKPGKKCLNIYRENQPTNFTISGCTSKKLYQPKYCGVCTDERCCIPYKSKTVQVEFQCPNGAMFTWQVMWINACFCNLSCKNPNDIFADLEQYYENREIMNWGTVLLFSRSHFGVDKIKRIKPKEMFFIPLIIN